MSLALKDVRRNPLRFTAAIAGCGLLVLGALGMLGLYRGIVADALTIINRIDADAWIVQAATLGPFGESSRIPEATEMRVSTLPAVASARRYTQISRLIPGETRPTRIIIVGIDYPRDDGRWARYVAGRPLRAAHFEVVADRNARLGIGQSVRLGRDDFRVVGLTQGLVDLGGDPVLLVTLPDAVAIDSMRPGDAVRSARELSPAGAEPSPEIAAILVKLRPGRTLAELRHSITQWSDLRVLSAEDQRQLVLQVRIQRLRLQIFFFVWLILLIVGVIVGLTTYALTVERLREISIIRVLGANNLAVARYIAEQAVLIGLGSCLVANAVGVWLFPRFPRNVQILPLDRLGMTLLVLAICMAGSLFAVQRALRASPQEVLS